jgi:hypothetical protein
MMNMKIWVLIGGVCGVVCGVGLDAWAGAGGEGDTSCIVRRADMSDPPGPKLTGILSVSADLISGNADVMLRLERTDEVHFFRAALASAFSAPTLVGAQSKLCEILSNTIPNLTSSILAAFNLPGSTILSTPRGIRNTQVIPSVDCNVDPKALECKIPTLRFEADPSKYQNPGIPQDQPQRGLTIADVVLFVQ